MVVTNRRFTQQAQELARRNDVTLWGRDELVDALLRAQKRPTTATSTTARGVTLAERPAIDGVLQVATAAAQTVVVVSSTEAFCARCGESVSPKVRDYCVAHADRFGGLVYCFAHQKTV